MIKLSVVVVLLGLVAGFITCPQNRVIFEVLK